MEKIAYVLVINRVINKDMKDIRYDGQEVLAVLSSKEEVVKYANKYVKNTLAKYARKTDKCIKHLDPYEPEESDEYDYFVTWSSNGGKLDYDDLNIGTRFVTYSYRKKGTKGYKPDRICECISVIETKIIEETKET
jgi:hypothetical protein